MVFLLALSLLLFLCPSTVRAGGDVVILNDNDWAAKVGKGEEPWFVDFFAPWCGHCRTMAPYWEELATELKGTVHVAKVDCTVNPMIRMTQYIDAFPTIKLYFKGRMTEYHGHRTTGPWKQFLGRQGALDFKKPEPVVEVAPKEHQQEKGGKQDIEFHYFNTKGRGELVRLILAHLGNRYEDNQYSEDQLKSIQAEGVANGLLRFGELPALQLGEDKISHELAILRRLARDNHVYIPKDPEAVDKMEMIMAQTQEMRQKYFNLVSRKDFRQLRGEFMAYITQQLGYFRNQLGSTFTFVQEDLSLADFIVFDFLNIALELNQSVLDKFPELLTFFAHFRSMPNIEAYYRSGKRPTHRNLDSAFFGNAMYPSEQIH